jgi:hemoglobin-like flavoprotein
MTLCAFTLQGNYSVAKFDAMSDQELIWASLETAAERCDDLVPPVYMRLFAARPEVVDIFAVGPGDAPNPAMGGMINEILTLIAEGIDKGVLDSTIMSTLVNHLGWGIDMGLYQSLLDAVIDAVRCACAEHWTLEVAAAWQRRTALIMDSLRANQGVIDKQSSAAFSAAQHH